jgi:hypothetical protein
MRWRRGGRFTLGPLLVAFHARCWRFNLMHKLLLVTVALTTGLVAPVFAQDDAEPAVPVPEIDESTPTTLTVIPDEVVRGEVAPLITVPSIAVGTVNLTAGPGEEGSVSVGGALEASVTSGLLGEILSGRPYTIFMPTNDALAQVPQDALAQLLDDPVRLAEVIKGYVVEGNIDTDAALALTREGGGEATMTSLGGSPVVVAAEEGALTVNGAQVLVPNLGYAGLVVHIIDGAILPGQPAP